MAEDHQEYIQNKINPVLENLVTQLLLERPSDPVEFMVKYLMNQQGAQVGDKNQESQKSSTDEIEKLKNQVAELQAALEAKDSAQVHDDDEDEEDEEDDGNDDVDDLPPPAAYLGQGPRSSVSAEAYGDWNKKKVYVPIVVPKTDDQKDRIKKVLTKSFLFSSLEEDDIGIVIDAMVEKEIEANLRIIHQGEDGDVLYVIESGTLDCYKNVSGEDILVKTCSEGDAFGELALLYNCPRAASVQSRDECRLWQLDRDTFGAIVKDAAAAKRQKYESFLMSVEILKPLSAYDHQQLADALHLEAYNEGDCIVKQGDPGDKFFIMLDGTCIAKKSASLGEEPVEVMRLTSGHYFGEIALLQNSPRRATIIATSLVKVLALSRRNFKNLLGSLEMIMIGNLSRYGL